MTKAERKLFDAITSMLGTGTPLVTVVDDGEIDFTSTDNVDVADHWANSAMQRRALYLATLEVFGFAYDYQETPPCIADPEREASFGHALECVSPYCHNPYKPGQQTCHGCGRLLPECRWGADWHGLFCDDCYGEQRRESLAMLTHAAYGPRDE